MLRTLCTVVLVSCVFGAALGAGLANSLLSINAWQLEFETKPYATLAQTIREQVTNPNAKAHIEETTHNFGVMHVRDEGAHVFFIRNVGTADLILTVDQTTCSCLGIDITPQRVPPGGTATCRLRYTAEQAIAGRFSQGGTVLTNDPENREIYLGVEGVFTNPVAMQPSSVNLPRVVVGTTRTATIRFYGFEDAPLQLLTPTWENREHFDFQWEPSQLTEADEEDIHLSLAKSVIEGTITLKPGLPVGAFQEWFQARTNYLSQSSVNFLVSGQVVGGNVTISGQGYNRTTGVADLGRTITGRSILREISIQFSGTAAQTAWVQLSAVEPPWIRAELSPPRDVGPLRIFSLSIEIPENAPSGSYVFSGDGQRAHITLETNDETMPALRIPLQFVVGR